MISRERNTSPSLRGCTLANLGQTSLCVFFLWKFELFPQAPTDESKQGFFCVFFLLVLQKKIIFVYFSESSVAQFQERVIHFFNTEQSFLKSWKAIFQRSNPRCISEAPHLPTCRWSFLLFCTAALGFSMLMHSGGCGVGVGGEEGVSGETARPQVAQTRSFSLAFALTDPQPCLSTGTCKTFPLFSDVKNFEPCIWVSSNIISADWDLDRYRKTRGDEGRRGEATCHMHFTFTLCGFSPTWQVMVFWGFFFLLRLTVYSCYNLFHGCSTTLNTTLNG